MFCDMLTDRLWPNEKSGDQPTIDKPAFIALSGWLGYSSWWWPDATLALGREISLDSWGREETKR